MLISDYYFHMKRKFYLLYATFSAIDNNVSMLFRAERRNLFEICLGDKTPMYW